MPPAIEKPNSGGDLTAAASYHSLRSDTNVLTLDDEPLDDDQKSPEPQNMTQETVEIDAGSAPVWSAHSFSSYQEPEPRRVRTSDNAPLPQGGVLNEAWVQRGLKNIGKTADGSGFCFLDLVLNSVDLKDISLISSLPLLQNVN